MTQVLETMMERQRLEMHKKLNEMFKTYFDAKTTTADDEAWGLKNKSKLKKNVKSQIKPLLKIKS